MSTLTTVRKTSRAKATKPSVKLAGPSLFEVEYLRQMKEEWELYLRSKNFSTILSFELVFHGSDYDGSMKVTA